MADFLDALGIFLGLIPDPDANQYGKPVSDAELPAVLRGIYGDDMAECLLQMEDHIVNEPLPTLDFRSLNPHDVTFSWSPKHLNEAWVIAMTHQPTGAKIDYDPERHGGVLYSIAWRTDQMLADLDWLVQNHPTGQATTGDDGSALTGS